VTEQEWEALGDCLAYWIEEGALRRDHGWGYVAGYGAELLDDEDDPEDYSEYSLDDCLDALKEALKQDVEIYVDSLREQIKERG
jgi:hypothetical protein